MSHVLLITDVISAERSNLRACLAFVDVNNDVRYIIDVATYRSAVTRLALLFNALFRRVR